MLDRRGHADVPVASPPRLVAPRVVVVATLLAATLLAGCGSPAPTTPVDSTTGPTVGPLTAAPATSAPATATPTGEPPTSAPQSAVSVAPPCEAADLKASHGLVEGAAGSVVTEVLLVSAMTCSVDAFPILGLRDATGAAIIGGVPAGGGRIDVAPDATYTSSVRLANWCHAEPAFPLELIVRLGGDELAVTGGSFPDEEGGMPPCNGESAAPVLEGGPWTPG